MFQPTQQRISEKIKSTLDSDALPFHEILDADMVESAMASEGVQFKDRIYTPFVTLCMFLSQVLDQDHSCRAAVMRLILWMALNDRKSCSAETTSYCEARRRLPLKVIVRLVHATAEKIEAGASDDWLWKGRRVSLVDGTTSSMPDTPRNQRAFPQANTQGVGLGFPIVRMAVIISLATGVARDMALGPYKGKGTGEPALLRALLDGLATDEIVLGDRYFGSFFMLESLMHREVDGLFRMYQGRKFDFRRGRRLGVEDHLVTWAKPQRPEWMDEETYAQIPDEMTVRELRFKVEQPGFRVDNVVLVTTMLDATMYTKDELADLYLQRWNVELDLRDQRCTPNGCFAVQVAGNGREGDLDAFTSLQLDPRCDGPSCRGQRKAATAAELQRHAANDHGIPRGNAASSAGGSATLAASNASRDRTTGSR